MDPSVEEGARADLPDGAGRLVDLAAKWMLEQNLLGPLPGATIEFRLDEHGRVAGWHAHTRGGRRELEPAAIVEP
jgi:hypothetical protein